MNKKRQQKNSIKIFLYKLNVVYGNDNHHHLADENDDGVVIANRYDNNGNFFLKKFPGKQIFSGNFLNFLTNGQRKILIYLVFWIKSFHMGF